MKETQRFTGKNEEQALERAERVLSVPRGEFQWSLVSHEKGFLGIGGSATIEVVVPLSPAPVGGPSGPNSSELKPTAPPAPPVPQEDAPEPGNEREDRPRSQPRGGNDRGRGRNDRGRGRNDRGRGRGRGRNDRGRGRDHGQDRGRKRRDDGPVDEAEMERRLSHADKVSKELLEQMGWEAGVVVERKNQDRILVRVDEAAEDLADEGRDLVDAYQFLLNKIVNRFPPRYRIQVDIAGMLEKFDAELTERAKAWCNEVLETGDEFWVEEELNPRDRRLVHLEVKQHEGIDSRSEGMGRGRRICIFPV